MYSCRLKALHDFTYRSCLLHVSSGHARVYDRKICTAESGDPMDVLFTELNSPEPPSLLLFLLD